MSSLPNCNKLQALIKKYAIAFLVTILIVFSGTITVFMTETIFFDVPAHAGLFSNSSNSKVTEKFQESGYELPERSDYDQVRNALKKSQEVDGIMNLKIPNPINSNQQNEAQVPINPIPIVNVAKVVNKIFQFFLYAEDWIHTDQEIATKQDKIFASPKISQGAVENPEVYAKFQKKVKDDLSNWTPDRDYPDYGYLPKDSVYRDGIGDTDVKKFWPEASKWAQERNLVLDDEDLVENFESLWDILSSN